MNFSLLEFFFLFFLCLCAFFVFCFDFYFCRRPFYLFVFYTTAISKAQTLYNFAAAIIIVVVVAAALARAMPNGKL